KKKKKKKKKKKAQQNKETLTVMKSGLFCGLYRECRKEALLTIHLGNRTLKSILRRLRDDSEDVRQTAFTKMSSVAMKSISITTRVDVLKSGLTDRCQSVRDTCSRLLERWLSTEPINNDIIAFLKHLDVEEYEEQSELILRHIIDQQLPLTVDSPPYVDISRIDAEHALYWRVLCQCLAKKKEMDKLENVVCDPIDFVKMFEQALTRSFVSKQLVQIIAHLNLQDEFSRGSLSNCCVELLKNVDVSDDLVPVTMKLLRQHICGRFDEDEFIRLIVETVNDIRDPLGAPSSPSGDLKRQDQILLQLERFEEEKKSVEKMLQRLHIQSGLFCFKF
ncbi:hypothetical protein RFI_19889, partial [Reticulomyxa filosa]